MARRSGPSATAVALLEWFDAHRRPLPWRRDRDPYRIWVAEVLLQQTRVAQAIPYYERFLAAFPTVQRLSSASVARVLKVWEGAGYYARARNLHAAAREIVRRRSGRLPHGVAEWSGLPGVGAYIARAIASLSENAPVVALEANGVRVAARWTLERGDVRSARVRERLAEALRAHLPPDRAGAFNEALMELGETVCRPVDPRCEQCPVARFCRARAELEEPGSLPARRNPRRRPHRVASIGVIEHRGRWLVQPRAPSGLLGGLWEFPGGKVEPSEPPARAVRREVLEEVGLDLSPWQPVGIVRHGYSHFTVELHVFRHRIQGSRPAVDRPLPRWLTPSQFARRARPKATEKAVALLAIRTARDTAFRG